MYEVNISKMLSHLCPCLRTDYFHRDMASTSAVAQGKRPQTPYTPSARAALLDDEGALTDRLVDALEAIFLKYAIPGQVHFNDSCRYQHFWSDAFSRRVEKRALETVASIARCWIRKAWNGLASIPTGLLCLEIKSVLYLCDPGLLLTDEVLPCRSKNYETSWIAMSNKT